MTVEDIPPDFRRAPENVTVACADYMARVTELRAFFSYFFGLIKFGALVRNKIPDQMKRSLPFSLGDSIDEQQLRYADFSHFSREILLSRAIESFDLYVLTILRDIFSARPEILKSEASIEIATIIELRSFEDIVRHAAERKLHDLSFKPLSELRKYVSSRMGIDLFQTEVDFETVMLATEVRNLIAHSDCRLNDIFLRRIGKPKDAITVSEKGKFVITEEWLHHVSYVLDGIVFDFDESVAAKFGIERTERFTSFRPRR